MSVLITGGTGSFGQAMTKQLLSEGCERVVILSRDEVKQDVMRQSFNDPRLRFFLGDVRDVERLTLAMRGVKTVYHAAALKRVPQCEYDPTEAVKTNILGSMNVCQAAMETGVECVVALSTDKSCSPTNLYGATKLCVEKIVTAYNAYSPDTRFVCVRYGNVAGSRGSVIPLWREMRWKGWTMTHPEMTRFWITLGEAVALAQRAAEEGKGGETFIPHLSAYALGDLATVVGKEAAEGVTLHPTFSGASGFAASVGMAPSPPTITGLRPGEKMHELMLSEDELHLARDYQTHLCLHPTHAWKPQREDGSPVLKPLTSDTAPRLSIADLQERLKNV